jgi:antigen 43
MDYYGGVGGLQNVLGGGTAINATVNFGGQQDIIGTAISNTVNNGGEEFVDGGNASGTTVTVATNT